jgi:hypothetical protein
MSIHARSSRRTFLRAAAATAAGGAVVGWGGAPWLGLLRPVSASEAKLDPSLVRLDDSIEPMVRLIEQTPRERLLEEVASRIRGGTASYREVLAGLLLAGVRNVPPRPTVGFKFHAVLVVNSAHLASLASPDADRWLPIFWALDYFKSAQAETIKQSGWRMRAVEEKSVPPAHKARQAFIDAMDNWDESAADVSAAALARHLPRGDVFELFARYAARDFRDIGHKTIFVANSFRTLSCIGWQHAEPVLRSLAYALLQYDGESPVKSDAAPDRPWRRNAKLVNDFRADWMSGEKDDAAATGELLSACRGGSSDDASAAALRAINDGAPVQRVWDALLCAAGERLMRRPGILALHAVTMTNAMRYCWEATSSDQTRRTLLLQNAAFLPMFGGEGKKDDVRIDQFDPAGGTVALPEILAELDHDRMNAARMTLRYLNAGGSAQDLITAARRLVFLKGTNSHDYKFSSAVMEDYARVSPGLRDRFLASAMFYLRGSGARDTELVGRTRAALNG